MTLSLNRTTLVALLTAFAAFVSATSSTSSGMVKLMNRGESLQPCVAVTDHFVFKDGPQYQTLDKDPSSNSWKLRGTTAAFYPMMAQLILFADSNASPKNIFVLRVHSTLQDDGGDYAYWLNKDQKCQVRVPRSTSRAALNYESYEVKVQSLNG